MTLLKKKNCRSAKNTLVLNLSEAKIPGVVRLDLSAVPFAHFHVRSGSEGSVLGYNDAAGQFTALALFSDRAIADKALHKIESVLLRPPCEITGGFLRAVVIVVGIILLLKLIGFMVLPPQQQISMSMPAALEEPAAPAAGEPMDADNKFGGQP